MFSIVIPLYNKEQSIRNTILSVLSQSFENYELLIINDGSTDASAGVIKQFEDNRIRLIHKSNGGVSSARNMGIKEAKYKWIAFLDADDLWESDHLLTLSKLINTYPNDRVFCTSYIRNTSPIPKVVNNSVTVVEDYFKHALTLFFWTSVSCVHKDVFRRVGYFLENFSRGEDIELWCRIGRYYRFIKSNLVTATYMVDSENKLTHGAYKYRNSTLSTVHKRFDRFCRASEKKYYLQSLLHNVKIFAYRQDFSSLIKTLYRMVIVSFKPVRNED